jgi:hypothetical protein
MFWTVNHPEFGVATLCDRCALLSINAAAADTAIPDFASVEEALAIINATCAVAQLPPLDIAGSELGECGQCTTRKVA